MLVASPKHSWPKRLQGSRLDPLGVKEELKSKEESFSGRSQHQVTRTGDLLSKGMRRTASRVIIIWGHPHHPPPSAGRLDWTIVATPNRPTGIENQMDVSTRHDPWMG